MKLVALSMLRNEEHWCWYALTSVAPHVDRILVFDNHSEDRTVDIVKSMQHIRSKLELHENFGSDSEHDNRSVQLEAARACGATHVLFLDGDEVHSDAYLGFARRLLELAEHEPALPTPPDNHGVAGDHRPGDGLVIRNIGFRPLHAGFAGPLTCIPHDLVQGDRDHGCYNFAIRIARLDGLESNGLEWGQHGYVEADGVYIQSSPYTLWMPKLRYWHLTHHPRSTCRHTGAHEWVRPVNDLGSVPLPAPVLEVPTVFYRPDGPTNPTLERWGVRSRVSERVGRD